MEHLFTSTDRLYRAVGKGEINPSFTVPAFNLRGLTFDLARVLFRVARETDTGIFIAELAPSERDYTGQTYGQLSASVADAARSEEWFGPIFLQADHLQPQADNEGQIVAGELERLCRLIDESLAAGVYNLDIDASTLVDSKTPSLNDSQKHNSAATAKLLQYIRAHSPSWLTVSVGGEIGHIGGRNSTVAEFRAFMDILLDYAPVERGINKISVQTGTHHGGVVLPDGSLADIDVDLTVLERISRVARTKYSLSGAVQHGASTLPDNLFSHFPDSGAIEIHLATGIQNLVFDHPAFPPNLKREMEVYLDAEFSSERQPGWTDQQFYYALRKKAWGKFKLELNNLPAAVKDPILNTVAAKVKFFMQALRVAGTRDLVKELYAVS